MFEIYVYTKTDYQKYKSLRNHKFYSVEVAALNNYSLNKLTLKDGIKDMWILARFIRYKRNINNEICIINDSWFETSTIIPTVKRFITRIII